MLAVSIPQQYICRHTCHRRTDKTLQRLTIHNTGDSHHMCTNWHNVIMLTSKSVRYFSAGLNSVTGKCVGFPRDDQHFEKVEFATVATSTPYVARGTCFLCRCINTL